MKKFFKWFNRIITYPLLILLTLFIIALVITHFITSPSNTRNWSPDQAVLSYADIKDNFITVHNVRNFSYTSTSTYTAAYYDKTYDLNRIKGVWYVVEPFSGFVGSAHTFLSFEFENNQFVSISIEIRKEKGESFSAFKGLFNQYELMYVFADEKDVIKLRSNFRKDLVYVYPVKTTQKKAAALFLDMAKRANELKAQPEFYNTLTNNCTDNIAWHVNAVTPNKVPAFSFRYIFPAESDKLAYKLGLIDTTLPFDQARLTYNINDRAMKYADSPDFSLKIRQPDVIKKP